jgi:alpha-glucosidase
MKYPTSLLFLAFAMACAQAPAIQIKSPDANLVFSFSVQHSASEQGTLIYSLSYKDKNVILPSRLGITTMDLPGWTNGFALVRHTSTSKDETWQPVYGERSSVRDHYNECLIELIKDNDSNKTLQVKIRVYNEGAAFCYIYPENLSTSSINIKDERSEFTFAEGSQAYVTPFAQELYNLRPLQDWTFGKTLPLPRWSPPTPEYESERPLTLLLANGLLAVIGEAQLVDYSRMKLALSPEKKNTIVTKLFGPVTESSPLQTPWRVIMVAENAGELIEHNDIFLNLNPPCRIADPGWIKPGKVMREVTLSTSGARACIDFCAQHSIEYVEFDAGWYGYEYSKESDASKVDVDPRRNPNKDLDLQQVLAYAKSKGVGVILYVNHRALEKQMEQIFPLYQSWGVAGLKFGFVHVGSHKWTSWVHEAVAKAAQYHLMVDIHDEYRPTGFSRTYPNLLTQEGIYGNECMPDADNNTIVPFTRFLAGAADYTICYYHQSSIKNVKGIKTTSSHQLALSVIYYSPFQFVFWYDKPSDYQGEPEIEFFEHMPTVWDDTRAVRGEIGQYVVLARRKADRWFVGAITNNSGRTIDIPLTFLEKEKTYEASIYSDGGEKIKTRTHVKIDKRRVNSETIIKAELKPSGGLAMELRPLDHKTR